MAENGERAGESTPGAERMRFVVPSAGKAADAAARRRERRAELAEHERRHDINERLAVLRMDVGSRLDPFTTTLGSYEIYDDEQIQAVAALRDYCENVEERFAAGDGLFLIGPPGTGKDHLAIAVARWAVITLGVSARWVTGPGLRGELRDGITDGRKEGATLSPYISADLLILSDPVAPGSRLTDFQVDAMFRIADERNRRRRPTFVTANFADDDDAEKLIGSQVLDRLSHGATRRICSWESYRTKGK